MRFLSLIFFFLSAHLMSEPATLMYYNSFGDYIVEDPYQVDIEVSDLSLKEIKTMLEKKRRANNAIDSDLVVIGYGDGGAPTDFFAATSFVNYEIPLKNALSHMPARMPNARWYIIYVDKYLSHHVRAKKDHHWASPFRWLAQIGLQDLQYFGPYLAH